MCYLGVPLPGNKNGENDICYNNIDEKKLHEFPGFNAPYPPDAVDVKTLFNNFIFLSICCTHYNVDM